MPRVYPEGGYADIGERRLEIEWWVFTKDALKRYDKPDFEFNYDSDQIAHVEYFPVSERDTACRRAQQICDEWDERHMPFAVVTLQEQVCDWFERDMKLAEWVNVGEAESFDIPKEKVNV
jgi:hypothetical protein